MIYQLKITLKYIKPPIWRRVEVRDSMTFYDLHRIIQNSFDWEDYHLHSFDIKRSAGTSTNHLITIGPMNQEKNQVFSFGFGYDYDEKKVILKEIFQNEKDRVLYVYDFGDNWEHDIVLEKIIPEENDIFYPRCTKVMRLAPEEDSRGESIFDDVVIKEIDGKSLMNEINQSLANEFENWLPQSFENYEDDWSELLDLAEEFKKLQPWKWMDDDQIIVVKDPETEELIYCSVMGGAGMEFGLVAFIGEEGYTYLNRLMTGNINDEKEYFKQNSLTLNLVDRGELEDEDYQLLKEHGRSYRGKNQWPMFRSFKPGYYPWFLDGEEVQLLSFILDEVIFASQYTKNMDQDNLAGRSYMLYTFDKEEYDAASNDVTKKDEIPLYVNELELQHLKHSLKRYNTPLEFDCEYINFPTQDEPDERPYLPTVILSVERKNQLIVYYNMIGKDGDITETVQKELVELVKRIKAIPREIWVKEEMARLLNPIAKKLNIQLLPVQQLPLLNAALKEMEQMMPE